MERQRGPVVDAISRLLGTVAILLGVGGGYFLYQDHLALKQEIASTRRAEEQAFDPAVLETEFKTKLDDWKSQINAALDKDDKAREARDKFVREKMTQVDAELAKLESDVDAKIQKRFETLASAPNLRLAENRMRPPKDGEVNFVVVANDGESDAELESVAFRTKPNGQFEVKSHMGAGLDTEDLVIQFSTQDNDGTDGRHRNYERTYFLPTKLIRAKSMTNVLVEIQNSDHVGWGWEGELELRYNDGKSLFVPSVRAVFVDSKADTT